MASLKELQKKLDDRTLNPQDLSREQRAIIDELINRGELKGPKMLELNQMRGAAADKIAKRESFYADPIGAALAAEDNPYFIKGRPTAELAGDLSGSIAPYVLMRKQIFGAANLVIFGKKVQVNFYKQQQKLQTDFLVGLN